MFDDLSKGQFDLRPNVVGVISADVLMAYTTPTNAPDWGQVAMRVDHDISHTHAGLDAKVAAEGVTEPIPLRARSGATQVLDGHHRLLMAARRGQEVPFCWSV